MAPIRIAGAHNPVNQVEFEIELPGDEILAFALPKMTYIAKPLLDKYAAWFEEWQQKINSDDPDVRGKLRDYEPALKMLELVLPKAAYTKVSKLTRGEILSLDYEWTKASGMPVGESSASGAS